MPNTLIPGLTLLSGAPTLNANILQGSGQYILQPTGSSGSGGVLTPVTGGGLPAPQAGSTSTTTTTTTTNTNTGTPNATSDPGTTVQTTATGTGTDTPAAVTGTPIYKQWWFWAAVGAVLLVGGYFLYKKMAK